MTTTIDTVVVLLTVEPLYKYSLFAWRYQGLQIYSVYDVTAPTWMACAVRTSIMCVCRHPFVSTWMDRGRGSGFTDYTGTACTTILLLYYLYYYSVVLLCSTW